MVVLDLFDMSHSQICHWHLLSKHFFLSVKMKVLESSLGGTAKLLTLFIPTIKATSHSITPVWIA